MRSNTEQTELDFRRILNEYIKNGQNSLSEETKQELKAGFRNWIGSELIPAINTHLLEQSRNTDPNKRAVTVITSFNIAFFDFLETHNMVDMTSDLVELNTLSTENLKITQEEHIVPQVEALTPQLISYFESTVIPLFEDFINQTRMERQVKANQQIEEAYKKHDLSAIYTLSKNNNIPFDEAKLKSLRKQVTKNIQNDIIKQQNYSNPGEQAKKCLEHIKYPASHTSYTTALEKLTQILETKEQMVEVREQKIKVFVKDCFSQLFDVVPQKNNMINNAIDKGNIAKLHAITSSEKTTLSQDQLNQLHTVLRKKFDDISKDSQYPNSQSKAIKFCIAIHFIEDHGGNLKSLEELFDLKKDLSKKDFGYKFKELILKLISQVLNLTLGDKAHFIKNQKETLNQMTQNLPLNIKPSPKER